MQREDLGDLAAFLAVLEEGSFTRAAAKLATSQSALSHTVQRLEARLGLRLLNRTTRRVAATEAGKNLPPPCAPVWIRSTARSWRCQRCATAPPDWCA